MMMTAQTDDNSVNLSYPSDDGVVSGSSTSTPINSNATQDPVTGSPSYTTTVDQPVVPQSIEDLDPNRGQQISGPYFESTSSTLDGTGTQLPEAPSPENMTGSMNDMLSNSPTTSNVDTPVLKPEMEESSSTMAVDKDTATPTENVNSTLSSAVIENKEDNDKEVREKKESPLQALARKLSELKSELIEEPAEKGEEHTKQQNEDKPPTEEPISTVPTQIVGEDLQNSSPTTSETDSGLQGDNNTVSNSSLGIENMKTEGSNSMENVNSTGVTVDGPASPVTPLGGDLNSVMPTLDETPIGDLNQETMEIPVLEGNNSSEVMPAVEDSSSEETIEPQNVDLNSVENTSISSDTPALPVSDIGLQTEETPVKGEALVSDATPDMSTPADNSSSTLPTVDNVTESKLTTSEGLSVIDENLNDEVTSDQIEENSQSGGKYVMNINKILDMAIERNASDVHISVGYPVMLRVDGSLIELHNQIVSPENAEELIFPLLSDQKRELLEVNREVDLAHTHRHGGEARFRINAFYTKQNLAAALRLIPTRIKTLEELMLPAIYSQFAGLKQGLILVTGPTGHGKSTTLAAILQHVNNNRATHILTIEDPIEYIFPKSKAVVDQREMHDDTHSWSVALKSALRQDPDVILVGEMRDYETIAATITLAETGHLVFATLHTNSASQTIDRIIDVFPENQQAQVRAQLSNILEAVIAQRLLPIDGGGRRAVSEILIGNNAVKNLIREGKTHQIDNVIRTSADIGMVSLEHSLVKLVREGLITMDRAQDYAVHPEEVVRLLKS